MNKTYIATMGERFFMSKIAIATDSNSGITQAQGRELGIFVMPMPFYINDELFLEDITLSQEQFYQRLEEGADVKTTQPAPGDVLELWDRILKDYDELVYIPMSSGLSSLRWTPRPWPPRAGAPRRSRRCWNRPSLTRTSILPWTPSSI